VTMVNPTVINSESKHASEFMTVGFTIVTVLEFTAIIPF